VSLKRTFTMVARDLRLGRRSPVFMAVVVMPLLVTFVVQIAFFRILDPPLGRPRLGIVDHGRSEITAAAREIDGIDVTLVEGEAELRELVENYDVDVGLVLADGFDAAVRAGERPRLGFHVSGESLLDKRIVLAVTAIDLVRKVEDKAAPVDVVLNPIGEGSELPVAKLMALFLTVWMLMASGMFVPALMLVEEREHGTLSAVIVTPAKMSEVLLSKAVLGLLMAIPMSYLTLVLNWALPARPSALLATLVVAAVICTEIGLMYGTAARDARNLFALMKTLNVFTMVPMIFYVFPGWPRWIAKLVPTFWFIDPIYRIALKGASLADVWKDLAVALGFGAVMVIPIVLLGRRMQAKLATA
jgi:ABC-2 type transport system permease protein